MTDHETALAVVTRVEGGVAMHREMTHAEAMALIRSWVELRDLLFDSQVTIAGLNSQIAALQQQIEQAGAASMSLGEPRK